MDNKIILFFVLILFLISSASASSLVKYKDAMEVSDSNGSARYIVDPENTDYSPPHQQQDKLVHDARINNNLVRFYLIMALTQIIISIILPIILRRHDREYDKHLQKIIKIREGLRKFAKSRK